MRAQYALRVVQGALVSGALLFGITGFTLDRHPLRQPACGVEAAARDTTGPNNPLPPCNCQYNSDCVGGYFYYCDNVFRCDGSQPGSPCGSSCTGTCVNYY